MQLKQIHRIAVRDDSVADPRAAHNVSGGETIFVRENDVADRRAARQMGSLGVPITVREDSVFDRRSLREEGGSKGVPLLIQDEGLLGSFCGAIRRVFSSAALAVRGDAQDVANQQSVRRVANDVAPDGGRFSRPRW